MKDKPPRYTKEEKEIIKEFQQIIEKYRHLGMMKLVGLAMIAFDDAEMLK
jgi:hypothetical protein